MVDSSVVTSQNESVFLLLEQNDDIFEEDDVQIDRPRIRQQPLQRTVVEDPMLRQI